MCNRLELIIHSLLGFYYFSFGSHVMGFAAQYLKNDKVARISGQNLI